MVSVGLTHFVKNFVLRIAKMTKSMLKSYEFIDSSIPIEFNSPFSPLMTASYDIIFICFSARGKDFWNFGEAKKILYQGNEKLKSH